MCVKLLEPMEIHDKKKFKRSENFRTVSDLLVEYQQFMFVLREDILRITLKRRRLFDASLRVDLKTPVQRKHAMIKSFDDHIHTYIRRSEYDEVRQSLLSHYMDLFEEI